MKRANEARPPVIVLRSHPPERLVRALARGEVAACCCCCCCCLHSVGGLAGAIVGTFYPGESSAAGGKPPVAKLRDDEIDGPSRAMPSRSGAGRLYWTSTLGVSALVCLWATGLARQGGDWLGVSLFLLALFLPVVQLAGSFVALLIVPFHPALRADLAVLKRLGRITAWTIVGAAIGIIVMVLMAIALSSH
jgi:hypothetical protein